MKKIFETEVLAGEHNVYTEDGGCAMIMDVLPADEGSLFVRAYSWSDDGMHPEFKEMMDKKVKITIEIEE